MSKIIRRKDAKEKGLTRYFTGKTCKNGHIDERITSNGRRATCNNEWKKSNRDKVNAIQQEWRKNNRERSAKYCKESYKKNNEKMKAQARARYWKNPEEMRRRSKAWANNNKGKVKAMSARYNATPESIAKRRDRANERLKIPLNNISNRIRCGMWNTLKSKKGGKSWQALVGYSAEQLITHLERQFTKGMSWENMGEWHIDHIIPVSSFNYDSFDHPDFKSCWCISNLRPMWAKENISKGDKRIFLL